jgi:hypothetical protein
MRFEQCSRVFRPMPCEGRDLPSLRTDFRASCDRGFGVAPSDKSAKARPALWQSVIWGFLLAAILGAVTLAPLNSIWVGTLALALLLVPLIAFRAFALMRSRLVMACWPL